MSDDDFEVSCPRERSPHTPCIARDGHSALADDDVCVGCGDYPGFLLGELADRMAATLPPAKTPAAQADVLAALVRRYVREKP